MFVSRETRIIVLAILAVIYGLSLASRRLLCIALGMTAIVRSRRE